VCKRGDTRVKSALETLRAIARMALYIEEYMEVYTEV